MRRGNSFDCKQRTDHWWQVSKLSPNKLVCKRCNEMIYKADMKQTEQQFKDIIKWNQTRK